MKKFEFILKQALLKQYPIEIIADCTRDSFTLNLVNTRWGYYLHIRFWNFMSENERIFKSIDETLDNLTKSLSDAGMFEISIGSGDFYFDKYYFTSNYNLLFAFRNRRNESNIILDYYVNPNKMALDIMDSYYIGYKKDIEKLNSECLLIKTKPFDKIVFERKVKIEKIRAKINL